MSRKSEKVEQKCSNKGAMFMLKKFQERVAKKKYSERHEKAMSFIYSKEEKDIDKMINATKEVLEHQ